MNKYLYKKIEQAHGCYFENLVFLASEVCKEGKSEMMEDFENLEYSEICKVLGWRDEKDVHDSIEAELKDESGVCGMLFQNNFTGFLAECHMPECSNFRTDEGKAKPSSWQSNPGICSVFWIYADSIGELVDKLEKEAESRFSQMYQKHLSDAIAK